MESRHFSRRCIQRVSLPGSLALMMLGVLAAPAFAQAPAATKPAAEKRLLFEMREQTWRQVFEWLSDQTGLPVVGTCPAGTFTLIAPRDADQQPRRFTVSEIVDFINEGLLASTGPQKHVLIRRQHAFLLMPLEGLRADVVRHLPLDKVQPPVASHQGDAQATDKAKALLQKVSGQPEGSQPAAGDVPYPMTHRVPGANADAMVKKFQGVYKDVKNIRIAAVGHGSILVHAAPSVQQKIAAELVKGSTPASGAASPVKFTPKTDLLQSDRMRVIPLENGNATAVAQTVQRLLPQTRKNPVKVVDAFAAPQPASDEGRKPADDLPGSADLPVVLTPVSNLLLVTSDDPQALAAVQELVRQLTRNPSEAADFEVIRLRNASAALAARLVDDLFNPAKERVRVVADPSGNAILVKASPIDLVTIRGVLGKAIDNGEVDSRALPRTWTVGPLKHTRAVEVARVLREVYRESLDNYDAVTTVSGGPFGFYGVQQRGTALLPNIDANGNPTGVTLSIGVDDQTNTLVLHCSEAMYEDVKKLVTHLEKAGADSFRVVKVIALKGVDARQIQQAVNAIQGRRRPAVNRADAPGVNPYRNGTYPGSGIPDTLNRPGFTPGGIPPGGGRAGGFRPGN